MGFSKYILRCCCLVAQFCPTMTPWAVARQAPLSMGFSRQEHWSGCHFLLQDLPNPGIEPASLTSPALAGRFFTTEPPGKPKHILQYYTTRIWIHIGKANSKVTYGCSAAWSVSAHNPRAVQGSTVLTLLHVHSWDFYLDKARQRHVLLLREKMAKNPEGWDKHLFLENVRTDSAGQVESARWRSKSRMTRDAPRTVGHVQGPGGDLLTQTNTWA